MLEEKEERFNITSKLTEEERQGMKSAFREIVADKKYGSKVFSATL